MSAKGKDKDTFKDKESMLLAGLIDLGGSAASHSQSLPHSDRILGQALSRRAATAEATAGSKSRHHQPRHSDPCKADLRSSEDSFRQLEQKYLSKIEAALARVDEQIACAVSRECRALRSRMESLQREVSLLKEGQDAEPPSQRVSSAASAAGAAAAKPSGNPPAGEPRAEDANKSIWAALDEHRQGTEAQLSDLQDWVADVQEALRLSQLEQRIQIVATGMLVFNAASMSEHERKVSMEALENEEASLQERMQQACEELDEDDPRRYDSKESDASDKSDLQMTPTRSIRTLTSSSFQDVRPREPGGRRRSNRSGQA